MFRRVLIANRGEIAVRIIRACRELDIETVAVYSTADENALHAQLATRALCIGPARAAESYLNMDAILTVAKAANCDAIHPGYGFLSENPDFADACAAAGVAFIGPPGQVIRTMGNKAAARRLMQQAGVPVVPGSDGAVDTAEQAKAIAKAKAPSTATVVKCELDEDDGRWVYELELRDGRTEYECDINAVTGVILDWEVDTND